jgi:hypothetical protein
MTTLYVARAALGRHFPSFRLREFDPEASYATDSVLGADTHPVTVSSRFCTLLFNAL